MEPTSAHYVIKGRKYIRVSRLLELTGVSDFSSIPSRDRQFYLDRGTARHELFEHVERGTDRLYNYDSQLEAYREGHAKFLRETEFKASPAGIEKRVHITWEELGFRQTAYPAFREVGVAGRLDRLGRDRTGRRVLWDYKGHEIPPSTSFQTAIYVLALDVLFSEVDRYGVAILPNGTYKMSQRYPDSDYHAALRVIDRYLSLKGE